MVLVYIYIGELVLAHVCVQQKPHYLSDLSKYDALLYETHSKVPLVLQHVQINM